MKPVKALEATPAHLSLADVHALAIKGVTPATAPQHPARSAVRSQPDVSKFNSTTQQKIRKPSEFKVAFNVPLNTNVRGKKASRPSDMLNTSHFSERSKTTITERLTEDRRKKND